LNKQTESEKRDVRLTYRCLYEGPVHYGKPLVISITTVAIVALSGIGYQSLLSATTTVNDDEQRNLCDFHHIKKFDANGKLIASWGEKGTGDGQFIHPHGIAVDSQGNVFVADEERQDVQKFNSNGTFMTEWGSLGRDAGQFSPRIEDINVDPDGNVYVVDYGNSRIQKFTNDGEFITMWGSKGNEPGQFDGPWGVTFDSAGDVYVSDLHNNRIQKFDSNGKFLYEWGSKGNGPGEFVYLHAVAIDPNDNVYVSDSRENGKVSKFTSDGEFITMWGSMGNKTGQFNEHNGIDFDSSGHVYVADTANQRIQVFTPDGEFIKSWGTGGASDDQFLMPHDIAIDSSQNIYVSDAGDAHPEMSYIERALIENKALTQRVCVKVYHPPLQREIIDADLAIETVRSSLEAPTAMTFLGLDDILVTEKNTGKVKRIVNGEMLEEPLLDLNVANQVERGLLGIAVSKNTSEGKTYVFLFYTKAEDGGAKVNDRERQSDEGDGGEAIGNHLYRYELSGDRTKLINAKLLLDLPYEPGPSHNGGAIAVGGYNNSNNVCVITGNLVVHPLNEGTGTNMAQNVKGGDKPDGRAGIICITQDGQRITYDYGTGEGGRGGILGDEHPLDMYYAYGIRNSFGIDFDPVTGNLWDTENGGFDEINLVEPGFNSGFSVVNGSSLNDVNKERFDQEDLVDFGGNGRYSDPELDLSQHVAPTAIVFLDSKGLGKEYENDLFVATVIGKILHFDLDESRRHLVLEGKLADKIANSKEELEDVVFADNMGTITDLKIGPDGYLYALIFSGDLVRIVPVERDADTGEGINS
jgi:aldose sugar dehydrogenase